MSVRRLDRILAALGGSDDGAGFDALCRTCSDELGLGGVDLAVIVGDEHRGALATSDPRAAAICDLAFSTGEGPCFDAHRSGVPVLVADLSVGDRWPGFAAGAMALGISGVFALPLRLGAARYGALDLYRETPGELEPDVLADAARVASGATSIVISAQGDVPPGFLTGALADVSDHRAVVHEATGRVAVQLDASIEAALVAIRARAFAEGRAVAVVADDVVQGRIRFDGTVR